MKLEGLNKKKYKKVVSFRLNDKTINILKKISEENNTTMTNIIEHLIKKAQ